jgi:hypothetical protein
MFNDKIGMKGEVQISVIDPDGNLKDKKHFRNLVVATGKNYIARRMTTGANAIMSHMAIGTANVTAVTGDTSLGGEVARVSLTQSAVTNNTISYAATFLPGVPVGAATITEAGIFNDVTANTGEMLCRVRFNEVNKANADTIVITWNVTVE